ncbi:hypothetical protein DBR11_17400, partial [Pedobacter sp. HMWF019]|uniref:alpha/beta hydrolase family protein n=1 Tax=Pedobacter sp. HMWF019 TaxID=2056856 RepID=UPI000D4DF348
INTSWSFVGSDRVFPAARGIAAWLPGDESVLIYDKYDIWKLDPSGKKSPCNLTNEYGLQHHIVFKLGLYYEDGILSKDDKLILSAFNVDTKDNGFFCVNINKSEDPHLLSMGAYVYHLDRNSISTFGAIPVKAKNAEMYIVQRMSATESPNYFSTRDFKTFNVLTDLHPEKAYSWYTSELHNWKSLDGRNLQGILYKPENFDATKQYPVIFYFYEKLSDGLNAFLEPAYSDGRIDIATYVSNGYLVLMPDIHYTPGDPMQGTYDAVISAANYVSKLPYVNSKKLGIQGHSFGGIQTNYLVANTSLFAAACTASGLSDMISAYGTVSNSGASLQGSFEGGGQYRMNGAPWDLTEAYVKNSPIFRANNITTPLLIMHNPKDGAVPFSQAIEFFTQLRRLGKKAWMLVYPNADHTVDGNQSKDFTIRMMQFFDFYLKDKPAPIWMLDGISASRRGIDTGLELDSTGRTPGPGLLTPEEKRKTDSLMTRPIRITLK